MRAAYDSSGGLTGLTPVTDEEGEPVYSFQPRQTNGAYDTTNGVYALSFGMGSQGIGSAALYLSNYDLTPGSTMNASVSFVNSGDVAIRAGKSQPASITLYAGEEKLAEWQITENVRAGQEVYTASTFVTLPAGLKAGDKLSRGLTLEGLTVSYFTRSSNTYDTLMQMGRWFGFRPGYLDACRLFTTSTLYASFSHISMATTWHSRK